MQSHCCRQCRQNQIFVPKLKGHPHHSENRTSDLQESHHQPRQLQSALQPSTSPQHSHHLQLLQLPLSTKEINSWFLRLNTGGYI